MEFQEIYKTYWPRIYRLCMGYVNDVDWAKDIAQESFVSVWKNLSKFRGDSSIGTWIFRIASNHCLRQIERENRMPKSDLPIDFENVRTHSEDKEEKTILLYRFISELPEIDRIIISLELEELAQAEIAKITGLSKANIRVKIHRIKKKLTQKFHDHDQ